MVDPILRWICSAKCRCPVNGPEHLLWFTKKIFQNILFIQHLSAPLHVNLKLLLIFNWGGTPLEHFFLDNLEAQTKFKWNVYPLNVLLFIRLRKSKS